MTQRRFDRAASVLASDDNGETIEGPPLGGRVVYDRLVQPTSGPITDFNTAFSGITRDMLESRANAALKGLGALHRELRRLRVEHAREALLCEARL